MVQMRSGERNIEDMMKRAVPSVLLLAAILMSAGPVSAQEQSRESMAVDATEAQYVINYNW